MSGTVTQRVAHLHHSGLNKAVTSGYKGSRHSGQRWGSD